MLLLVRATSTYLFSGAILARAMGSVHVTERLLLPNSNVTQAVTAGQGEITISNAEQFIHYRYFTLNKQPTGDECQHFVRPLFWVPSSSVLMERPRRQRKTMKSTRMLHHGKSSSTGGALVARHLTCTCASCMREEACLFRDIAGPQKEHALVPDDDQPGRHPEPAAP
ncbi:hypothetical protein BaRGS_00023929, partial [Batillaria attramentaria]